jgi:hypothetical protein
MEIATENLTSNSEHWASIDGYTNYQVSWWGRVRNTKTGRILKPGLDTGGYQHVALYKNKKAKTIKIHRLVAREWVGNPEEKRCVDHVDGIRTNNNWENLRWATHSENSRNMKRHTDGSSIYKGVGYNKALNKWQAQMHTNGKQTYLGLFANEREAAEAYNAAAVLHYKEFAKLNVFED